MENNNTKPFYNTEIPGDWEVAELGKITEKIGDGLHGTPEYINCSEYFFINGNNLKEGTIHITEGTKCVSEEVYLKHKKDLKYKSILLSINGTIGSVAFFKNEKIVLGKSAAYINCKGENVDFLFHYLQSKTVINFFEGELTGSTIRNLSLKSIREIPIPLPPLPEQRAITQVLSTADTAIHTTEKLIAQKELRKKWLMQQLLTGKKRLKGFGGEWKLITISKLFKPVDRYVDWNENELYNLISIRRRNGGVFFRDSLMGYQIGVKKLKEVRENDFVVSKRQVTHGAWAVINPIFSHSKVSDEYNCLVISNTATLTPDFWKWYCQLPILTHFANIDSDGVHIEKSIFDYNLFKRRKVLIPTNTELEFAKKDLEMQKF